MVLLTIQPIEAAGKLRIFKYEDIFERPLKPADNQPHEVIRQDNQG